MKHFDYIILGQGLAGSLLAWSLIQKGKSVLVLDDSAAQGASRVAAGMFNPVVFKRLNFSWNAHSFLPIAKKLYTELEASLDGKWWNEMPLARFFGDQFTADQFEKELAIPPLGDYLSTDRDDALDQIRSSFGYGVVKYAGFLDINKMLTAIREFLIAQNAYVDAKTVEADFTFEKEGVVYKDIQASALICCHGYGIKKWRSWKYVPVVGAKGEILHLKGRGHTENFLLNNSKYLLPIGNGEFLAGSTYEWRDLSLSPTESAKNEILSKLKNLLTEDLEVVDQKVGIRPTSKDRRPIIGEHPRNSKMKIFNGLGTRGVIVAPAMVEWFCDHLINGAKLPDEVNVSRFNKYFQ
ncbi:MAG: glycine oxidase [Flavobacteriales bacterium]